MLENKTKDLNRSKSFLMSNAKGITQSGNPMLTRNGETMIRRIGHPRGEVQKRGEMMMMTRGERRKRGDDNDIHYKDALPTSGLMSDCSWDGWWVE